MTDKIKMRSEEERTRVIAIAEKLVMGQVRAGKLDPNSRAAFKKAVGLAVLDATAAYHAAEEFLCG